MDQTEKADFLTCLMPSKVTSQAIELLKNCPFDRKIPEHFKAIRSSPLGTEALLCIESAEGRNFAEDFVSQLNKLSNSEVSLSKVSLPIASPRNPAELAHLRGLWPASAIFRPPPTLDPCTVDQLLPFAEILSDPKTIDTVYIFPKDRREAICARSIPGGQNFLLEHPIMSAIDKFAAEICVLDPKQYLLTESVVLTKTEPCVMCAMALVHSRVKTVVYCEQNERHQGGLNEKMNLMKMGVNHTYDVFVFRKGQFFPVV